MFFFTSLISSPAAWPGTQSTAKTSPADRGPSSTTAVPAAANPVPKPSTTPSVTPGNYCVYVDREGLEDDILYVAATHILGCGNTQTNTVNGVTSYLDAACTQSYRVCLSNGNGCANCL
ncbi:hypothetical protein C8R44DRAFT_865170 [Mycena epipterygia]|nr:hypothetical protein C8R44DRAFT_865170 [Mycena epipterygia]